MTRACTLMNRRHKGVLSVGRLQTPTLRLVVERDREITRFTPRSWWRVDARLHAEGCSFLAQFLPGHEVDKTELRLNCAGETLTARGSVVIVSG